MSLRRFGLVTRVLDPSKYGKLVQKEFIKELEKDVTNGITYIECAYSKRELKVKLGLVYEQDIIEHNTVDNPVDNKKAESTEKSKPAEVQDSDKTGDNLDPRESELSLREAKLSLKESELNKKELPLSVKKAEFEQKQSDFDKNLEKFYIQSSASMSNEKGKQKFRLEVPEILSNDYEDIQNFAKDIKTFHSDK